MHEMLFAQRLLGSVIYFVCCTEWSVHIHTYLMRLRYLGNSVILTGRPTGQTLTMYCTCILTSDEHGLCNSIGVPGMDTMYQHYRRRQRRYRRIMLGGYFVLGHPHPNCLGISIQSLFVRNNIFVSAGNISAFTSTW